MNWKKIILVVVFAGALTYGAYAGIIYFNKQKKLLEDYDISLIGIKLLNVSGSLLNIEFTLRMVNKASVEATVQEVFANVELNGALVGTVTNAGQFIIPAKGSSDIKLVFSIATKEILKNLVDALLSVVNTKDVSYKLVGHVKLKSSFAAVSVPFDYSGYLKQDMLS